jgi:hypothetical protein
MINIGVVVCPYCGNTAQYVDSSILFGKSFGMIYLCRPCDAYVGVHKNTNVPLGTLAKKELRQLRQRVHETFDDLWKHKRNRQAYRMYAYKAMERVLNLPVGHAHIGMFDEKTCLAVFDNIDEIRKTFEEYTHG